MLWPCQSFAFLRCGKATPFRERQPQSYSRWRNPNRRDLPRHEAEPPDHVHFESFQIEMARPTSTGASTFTYEEALPSILEAESLLDPGSGWAYTDTGHLLLGFAIEAGSGREYYHLIDERLREPQGLADTRPSNLCTPPGLAAGHVAKDDPFSPPFPDDGCGRVTVLGSGDGLDRRRLGLDVPRPRCLGAGALHGSRDGGALSGPPV